MKQQHSIAFVLGLLALGSGSAFAESGCEASCNGSSHCRFRGMQNSTLGGAELSIDPNCRLVTSGVGTSGFDGVVQTGLGSTYMKTTLGTPNLSLSAQGTSVKVRQVGIVDSIPDQEIMLTEVVNFNGDDLRHSISCSEIQVAGYRISIFQEGQLVEQQDLGVDPPTLIYPKTDLESIACGIWPDGNTYSVFQFAKAQPIRIQFPASGPFFGDLVFVEGHSPARIPIAQTGFENIFTATGPVTIASMEAGATPGSGTSCWSMANRQALNMFAVAAWRALSHCAADGSPVCPAPCSGYPTLEESGLDPVCYGLASGYLDQLATIAFGNSWGADRCPTSQLDGCGTTRSDAVQKLLEDPSDLAPSLLCRRLYAAMQSPGCITDVCAELARWTAVLR